MSPLEHFLNLILVIFIAIGCSADKPSDPLWPNTFMQTFKETFYYPVIGTHNTKGVYYYDYANLRYRIDRENGRYDRYCGFNGNKAFKDTPCTQLVLEGQRWLIYPDLKECCQCCDAQHGCGVLKPTWLQNATYLGIVDGNFKWNQKGLQDNFYLETAGRVMLQINQVPNDIQDFDPSSFTTTIENADEVFKLPAYCEPVKCSLFSTCRAVGK
ncbi:uncharacterized protein LOC105845774 [Hydra vulgaris]|uniref:uncharacterized protein LOC105845774 n=1 Tax=Hydra vulgaris TaxID=6087 RepID=UPI001F5F3619|nr:uncharacterized protein LOC105845774 [Hydra vulgaris]